jgi:hypothetical protein
MPAAGPSSPGDFHKRYQGFALACNIASIRLLPKEYTIMLRRTMNIFGLL